MRSLPFSFGLALAALVSVVVLGVVNTRSDLQTLHDTSQENIFWSAAQVERQYGSLQVELARMVIEPSSSADAVRRQFDILWSRVELFGEGDVGTRLLAYDNVRDVHERLIALLKTLDPTVANLTDGDVEGAADILSKLEQLEPDVRASTVRVLRGDEQRFSEIRNAMREGMLLTAAALILTVIVALTLIVLVTRDARKKAALAAAATSAATSRKQFFSTMSHELRTPLNGMLGALALVREEEDAATRKLLIEEAQSSAHRLSNLVTDAIDLNADDDLELKPVLFRVSELIDAVQKFVEPELLRRDAKLRVAGMISHPGFVKADFGRISNALSHIAINALQRGGAQELRLFVSIENKTLSVEVGTDVTLPHDAFGETLARGIVERIGGSVDARETMRVVTVPITPVDLTAKLAFNSRALRRMYEALLKANAIEPTEAPLSAVSIVLVEATNDASLFSALRREHGNAVLIACGVPSNGDLFDGVASTPDELMKAIQTALDMKDGQLELAA